MIIFASFIDPALDLDLLPAWIRHYKAFKFDRYHAAVHVKPLALHSEQFLRGYKMLRDEGFDTEEAEGPYRNGDLQNEAMTAFKATLEPDDTLVLADSDEFHKMADYREAIEEYDYIDGRLVDRWDDTLHPALTGEDAPTLDVQYPRSGDLYAHLRELYGLADENWIWDRQATKVLAHRVRYGVDLHGNHFILPGPRPARPLQGITVDHFTWREGVIRRIMSRSYNPEWWTVTLMKHFGYTQESAEYAEFRETHARKQAEKGLVPLYV